VAVWGSACIIGPSANKRFEGTPGTLLGPLFTSDTDRVDMESAGIIDPLLHQPADRIKDWPEDDLYKKYSL
jgi:hypothetical protein